MEMLANNKALTDLDLSHCRIGASLGISSSLQSIATLRKQMMHTRTRVQTF